MAGVRREEHDEVPVAAGTPATGCCGRRARGPGRSALGQLSAARVARDPHVAGGRDPAGERVPVVRDRARVAEVRPGPGPELAVTAVTTASSPFGITAGARLSCRSEQARVSPMLGKPRDQQLAGRRANRLCERRPCHKRAAAGMSRPRAAGRWAAPSEPAGANLVGRGAYRGAGLSEYRPIRDVLRPGDDSRPRRRLPRQGLRGLTRSPSSPVRPAAPARPRTGEHELRALVTPGDQHAAGGRDRRIGDRHPAAGG